MFELDERLSLCASYVRQNAILADIGTDHAYLPVWLALNQKISSAAACDIREKPLESARNNIQKYHVENTVSAVLSDGLQNLENKYTDIVIAGMGGELIVNIISSCEWLKDHTKRLILQPMTKPEILRNYLCENGWDILSEKACISHGKPYSVMCCEYYKILQKCDLKFQYIGLLDKNMNHASKIYITKIKNQLEKKIRSIKNISQKQEFLQLINELEKLLSES